MSPQAWGYSKRTENQRHELRPADIQSFDVHEETFTAIKGSNILRHMDDVVGMGPEEHLMCDFEHMKTSLYLTDVVSIAISPPSVHSAAESSSLKQCFATSDSRSPFLLCGRRHLLIAIDFKLSPSGESRLRTVSDCRNRGLPSFSRRSLRSAHDPLTQSDQ